MSNYEDYVNDLASVLVIVERLYRETDAMFAVMTNVEDPHDLVVVQQWVDNAEEYAATAGELPDAFRRLMRSQVHRAVIEAEQLLEGT